MILCAKIWGWGHGLRPVKWRVSFLARPASHVPQHLGNRQAIGMHTGAGRQSADAIETGISADKPAPYYTRVREAKALGRQKAERGWLRDARLRRQNGYYSMYSKISNLTVHTNNKT